MAVMSMAMLSDQPMMWRGPMVSKAMVDLLVQTTWPDLDYLLIDLPPGTGDVQLTLSKQFPLTGALMVTTPHPLSVVDTLKGILMFKHVKVPMLGVVENMSHHACSACGHVSAGESGGKYLAEVCALPLLASLPSAKALAYYNRAEMEEALLAMLQALAYAVLGGILSMPVDYSSKFGAIRVE
jgi:ATP-binding protein involved in chromosome partitioning